MAAADRQALSRKVAEAIRARDEEAGIRRCVECGGELVPGRYTVDCEHCRDRKIARDYRRRRRARGLS